MRIKRRYLVLVEGSSAAMNGFIEFFRCQGNSAQLDSRAYLIDSWLDPDEITDEFRRTISGSAKAFVCEMTGEITWRNPLGGMHEVNKFFKKSLY